MLWEFNRFLPEEPSAAFFEHLEHDLAEGDDWRLIDCDAVDHRELVLLLSANADIVLLLSDYSDGAKSHAYDLAGNLRSGAEQRPAILAVPSAVRNDEMEILHRTTPPPVYSNCQAPIGQRDARVKPPRHRAAHQLRSVLPAAVTDGTRNVALRHEVTVCTRLSAQPERLPESPMAQGRD